MTFPTLSTPVRLGAFVALLAVTFGAAFGLGALVDPTDGQARSDGHATAAHRGGAGAGHGAAEDGAAAADGADEHGAGASHSEPGGENGAGHDAHAASAATSGLRSVEDGYRLVPAATRTTAGRAGTFRFRIEDPEGRPVRSGYELESERELHLIVVRRDGRGFQHLHPSRAPDGTWSTPLTLPSGGSHRVLADFVVGGTRRVLGVDLEVAGDYRPAPPATPSRTAEVDGLRVALDGAPRTGREETLRFRVTTAGGRPVRGLQPYLGARGHLVALREGDLSYLHVHPVGGHAAAGSTGDDHGAAGTDDHGGSTSHDHGAADAHAHATSTGGAHGATGTDDHDPAPADDPAAEPGGTTTHVHEDGIRHTHDADAGDPSAAPDGEIAFAATFPAAGRHRLYLQFRIAGVVRTVPFVVDVAR